MEPKLIKNIDEIKTQVPINMTSDFDVVSPFLANAEAIYVQRLIGDAQFTALVTAYTDNADDDQLKQAIAYCQKVIANLGYYFAVPVLSVSVGSSGIQVFSNSDTKQAFQWQVNDLKDSLQDLGFSGIEELLTYLQSDPDKFSAYAGSDQLKAQKSCLINTALDFSSYFSISNSRFVFQSIVYLVKRVEQQIVTKVIGADLLSALKTEDLSDEQSNLVNDYLKPGIALLTIAKAIVERVITLQNGIASFNFRGRTENMNESQAANSQQIGDMACQLSDDGNLYLQDGLAYIKANPDAFPGFIEPISRRRFRVTNDPRKGAWAN